MPDDELLARYEQADTLTLWELAQRAADPTRKPVDVPATTAEAHGIRARTMAHELDDLVAMAALAKRLTRWLPISIHRALIAGASVDEVATATGMEFREVTRAWRQWAEAQRTLNHKIPNLGLDAEEYDRVDDLIRRAAYDRTLPEERRTERRIKPAAPAAG